MARGRPSKKSHIIDIALTLFSRVGYQGTSIDQVVTAAQVSKPTVYSNFSSKQILWQQALARILEKADRDLAEYQQPEKTAIEQWLGLWSLWLADPNRLAVYRIMLGESHNMEAESFALFEQLEARFEQAQAALIQGLSKPLTPARAYVLKATSKEALLMPKLYAQQENSHPGVSLSPEQQALLVSLLHPDETV